MINADAHCIQAIRFFGALAYPGDVDGAAYFRECASDLLEDRSSECRRREAENKLKLASRRIFEKRLPAGRVLQWLLLSSNLFFGKVEDPIGVNICCSRLADELNDRPKKDRGRQNGIRWTRERVIQEIWSPSKPVIHYAYAFAVYMDDTHPTADVRDFILQPTWLARVLAKADAARDLIDAAPNIRINREQLVRDLCIAGFGSLSDPIAVPPSA